MQSHHPVRDRIESVEKYVEQMAMKAQGTNIPGVQSMISTAKKVGSPMMKGVRRLGEPVVDAIDSGITNVAKNGTAILHHGTGMAQQGVEKAFHVTDRVLTPPPNEREQPKTIRGLCTHVNNGVRYFSATKVKPVLTFDPYEQALKVLNVMLFIAVAMYTIAMTPVWAIRDRLQPSVMWAMGHKCLQPNGLHHGHGDGGHDNDRRRSGVDEHRDQDLDEASRSDERAATPTNRSSSSSSSSSGADSSTTTSSNTSGPRCSTGTSGAREAKGTGSGTSGHAKRSSGANRGATAAKANATNSHTDE